LRNPAEQAEWLRAVRTAASDQNYPLVINARIDVFLAAPGRDGCGQAALIDEALRRAHAYHQAGADCLFRITHTRACKNIDSGAEVLVGSAFGTVPG
jgi:2-methylisocitrate lyase-like PEP mutase family enzyme